MEETFRANSYAIQKAEKKRTREFLEVLAYTLIAIMSIFLQGDEFVFSFAKDFSTPPSTIRTWLTIFAVAGAVFAILSLILGILADRSLQNLRRSYVKVGEQTVSGTTFDGASSQGKDFSVNYCDIRSASISNNGHDLIIHTKRASYHCLQIGSAAKAAYLINQKLKAASIPSTPSVSTTQPPIPPEDTVTCIFCNTVMPKSQVYCGACGRRRN